MWAIVCRSLALVSLLGILACGSDPPNVGGTCTSMGGCDEGLTCDTTVPDGYCTKTCAAVGSAEGCPEESICDSVAGVVMGCVKICTTSADCRAGHDCSAVAASNLKACTQKQ